MQRRGRPRPSRTMINVMLRNGAHTSSIDMKNHIHASRDVFEPVNIERFAAAQKCTWVSVWVNLLLTLLQLVVGYFGRSQALVADGLDRKSTRLNPSHGYIA